MKNRLNEEDFTKWRQDAVRYPLGHTEGTFHTPAYMNYYNEGIFLIIFTYRALTRLRILRKDKKDKSLILSQLPRTRLHKLKGEKGKQIKSRMPFGYLGNKLCVPKVTLKYFFSQYLILSTRHFDKRTTPLQTSNCVTWPKNRLCFILDLVKKDWRIVKFGNIDKFGLSDHF